MKNKFDHLKEQLMTDIKSGALTPAPRWREVLYGALIGMLALIIFALTVAVFVYLFFALRIAGFSALLGFGFKGVTLFLVMVPWKLIILDVFFVLLVTHHAQRFSLAWKVPRLYFGMAILLAAFAAGYILDHPINDRVYKTRDALPEQMMYMYEHPPPPRLGEGFTHGTIVTLDVPECVLSMVDERTGDVVEVWAITTVCVTLPQYEVGQSIIVAGEDNDGVLQAYGIQPDIRPPRKR